MSNIDTASLQREITSLSEKINSKDNEVTALMNVVIETNKGVSDNLVKLTQVVSNVNVLEKAQEAQRKTLNDLGKKVSANETNIKLSLQDKQHIKQSLEEIKTNQKEARAFVAKILGTLMTLAIIGGLTTKFIG
jgi:chromosome segregation ATPase